MTQLGLANNARISARHLSFIETGRAAPSRDMILLLAMHLDVPLRERNDLLLAGGYAPAYAETALEAPRMSAVPARTLMYCRSAFSSTMARRRSPISSRTMSNGTRFP